MDRTSRHALPSAPTTLTTRRRWVALLVLCAGLLMIILDGTVVTVALPSIQQDLGFSATELSVVVSAYLVPFGGVLLLAGRIGDLTGRRRVFLLGVAGFTIASGLCGLATTPAMLIGARFLQGAAGAVASAVILAMVIGLFPDGSDRARAIGIYSFVGAAGAAIGLLAGGVLTETLSWHWVFLVNVPIGLITVGLALRFLPADMSAPTGTGRDVSGAVLVTTGLMLTVYTVTELPARGWNSTMTIVSGIGSVLLLTGFLIRERLARHPLLPLSVFGDRRVWSANLVQFLLVGALFAFQFLLALYLQLVLGFGAAATGLAFLPITVVIGIFSLLLTPRAIVRWGGRRVLVAGVGLVAIGLLLLSRIPVYGSYPVDILPATVVMGAGGGLTLPAIATLGMSTASAQDSGLLSGLLNTTQQLGGALGLAVLSSLAAARTGATLMAGADDLAALTAGYRLALQIGAAMAGVALVIAIVALRERHSARAVHTEIGFDHSDRSG